MLLFGKGNFNRGAPPMAKYCARVLSPITGGNTLNHALSSFGLPGPFAVPVSHAYCPLSAVPSRGITSTLSVAEICRPKPHCRRLERQFVASARCFAFDNA